MNQKLSVTLGNLQQTLLITLYGKALESRQVDSILNDHYAAEVMERLDFDFSQLRLSPDAILALAVRAKVLDDWTHEFLQHHPRANVVHLGCGLDSRLFRLSPSEEVTWWEIDFPEVIALRQDAYESRPNCQLVGGSMLDRQWLAEIPSDVPTLIVAEGVLPYFQPVEVTQILTNVVNAFDQGQVIFDAYNAWGIAWLNRLPIMRQTNETLSWAIDEPRQLETEVRGLRLVTEQTEFAPDYVRRASWAMRHAFRLSRPIPFLRRMGQLLRYDFGPRKGLPHGEGH